MTMLLPVLAFLVVAQTCFLILLARMLHGARVTSERKVGAIETRLGRVESRGEGGAVGREEVSSKGRSVGSGSTLLKPSATRSDGRHAVRSPVLITIPDLTGPTSSAQSEDLVRRYGAIWDLAEAGASAESIARETGQPVGRVELILGLKRPRAGSGSGGSRP